MTDSGPNEGATDADAKRLVVALELLRRQLVDDATLRLNNATRKPDLPIPSWAAAAALPFAAGRAALPDTLYHTPHTPLPTRPAPKPEPEPTHPQEYTPAGMPIGRPVDPTAPEEKARRRAEPPEPHDIVPDTSKDVRVRIVGHEGQPIPVYTVGGMAEYQTDQEQRIREVMERPEIDTRERAGGKKDLPSPKPKDKDGGGAAIASALMSRFAFVLGPLAAFGTILSANNSGFQVFGSAVKVLGATLAPLVMPAFVLLSTAVVAVSDVLWSKLMPRLGDFYKSIFETGIPAVMRFADSVEAAADGLEALYDNIPGWMKKSGKATASANENQRSAQFDFPSKLSDVPGYLLDNMKGAGTAQEIGKQLGMPDVPLSRGLGWRGYTMDDFKAGKVVPHYGWLVKQLTGKQPLTAGQTTTPPAPESQSPANHPSGGAQGPAPPEPTKVPTFDRSTKEGREAQREHNRQQREERQLKGYKFGPGGEPGQGEGAAGFVPGAMKDVLRSLQQSLGPKAAFSSLTEVGKQAQLAALNQDPLDAKVFRRGIETLQKLLESVDSNTKPKPKPEPLYEGGGGGISGWMRGWNG